MTVAEDVIVSDEAPADGGIWIDSGEGGDDEQYRTILEIWTKVLEPVEQERTKKVKAQWATRVVSGYPGISFKDMPLFRDMYYAKVQSLADILADHIATEAECLNATTAQEDARINGLLYRAIITDWQKRFLLWELSWDTEAEWAALDIATIAEVHKMFFSDVGIIGLLDQIDIEFTDDDRDALAAELAGLKEEVDGR